MIDDIKSYEDEAKRIISLLKKDFRLPRGELCLEKIGDYIFPHHIFPDLGDFLPFFLYFGERSFIDGQIDLFKKTLKNGLLVSDFPSFSIKNLSKSYEYSDLLFGLFDYFEYKNDTDSKELLLKIADSAVEKFNFDKNIYSFYHSKLNINIPIFDTRDGTFIEFYVNLFNITKQEKYKTVAYNIYQNLIGSSFYKKNKLFPIFEAPIFIKVLGKILGINKFSSVVVCKNNTNTLFGFLSLYSLVHDDKILINIDEIINSIEKNAILESDGVVMCCFLKKPETFSTLTASFPMVDFLCDLYMETKRIQYLRLAEKIANYWIGLQGNTGLFPLHSDKKESFLDSETDMSVALYKLFELTNKNIYKESADKCFDGIIKYHGIHDYVLGVNIDTGEILNKTQRTKFITLFLKLLILKINIASGKNIYGDSKILNILKDR